MLIEVKEIEYCRLNVKFEGDEENVKNKEYEMLQHFKQGKVPGFREGKATTEAVKFHFKNQINEAVKNELAYQAFQTVIAEKNIKPFGQPQFLAINLDGSKFKCEFCVNQVPNIELSQYKNFELPKGTTPNSIEMSEKILQELRVRNGETLPFSDEDFIQLGDTAIINYIGYLPGEEVPTIKKDGEIFVVGKAHADAFNDNILGMKLGESREFTTILSLDSAAQHIAGKEVRFVIELAMASKSEPAPLDDELATKVGCKNLEELNNIVQGMSSNRVKELETKYLSDQVAARLLESHNFELPSWLTSFEAKLFAKQQGHAWESLSDEHKSNFLKMAEQNVKLSIILDKVREIEPDAQLTDEEVFSIIKQSISKYKTMLNMADKSDEEVLSKIAESGYTNALISQVRDDATMDFIIKNSSILE